MGDKLAILLTCYNRKKETLNCLTKLYTVFKPKQISTIDIYLVDDGSTDGTKKAIKTQFPEINIINGNGQLYWNKGMQLAWYTASQKEEYDFFLWLNDDVKLEKFALIEMIECYQKGFLLNSVEPLIVGSFKEPTSLSKFSYGGRTEEGPVIPNGSLQNCTYVNGNAILISKKIFKTVGGLSNDYTHSMGDFDFGLRVLNEGFINLITRRFIGTCPRNGTPQWSNPKLSLRTRLKFFKSPLGLNIREYIIFRKKFWRHKWIIFTLKAYFRVLFPSLYNFIKKNI